MSHYCLQPETRSALPSVLHDVESSLESKSAVLQNIHILDSSLSWNSIAIRHLWQGCHTAEAKYVPFHDSREHVMKSHQMKGDGVGIVFSVFLGSRGGWQGTTFSRGRFHHHSSTISICLTLHSDTAQRVALLLSALSYIWTALFPVS